MRERLESEGRVEGVLLNGVPCTLGEGNTPLVRSERLARDLGVRDIYFKLESTNPSGSF